MALSEDHKHDLKVMAAYYYYKKKMNLSDIADKLKISRVTLNKLLKAAYDEGLVRIEIVDRNNTLGLIELEESVKERFQLKDIKIVDTFSDDPFSTTNEIALAAAQLIDRKMENGIQISISWGRTLELMVNYLRGNNFIKDIKVYTLLGAPEIIGTQMQPNTIAHNLLRKYSGTGFVMNAPFVCETEAAAQTLMADKTFTSIVEGARQSDLTLVGIGPSPNENINKNLMRYDLQTIKELKATNVCGDICSSFYDIYGNLCQSPLCERFIKVGLNEIKKHRCVIGMAGGSHKIASILGALNGHYLDVLITDKNTIIQVIEMADKLGV